MEAEEEQMRVRRRTVQAVLEQCREALELLQDAEPGRDPTGDADMEKVEEVPEEDDAGDRSNPASPSAADYETYELCDLLKSRVESPDFLQKLGNSKISVPHRISADDSASWDFVNAIEFWEDEHVNGDNESEQDDYVLVRQEDIVDGIASFMAAYLLSLKQTKDLTPNQLQKALCKTFSVKKKKSKLRKAWDGSKVVYNVASWSATAIGCAVVIDVPVATCSLIFRCPVQFKLSLCSSSAGWEAYLKILLFQKPLWLASTSHCQLAF